MSRVSRRTFVAAAAGWAAWAGTAGCRLHEERQAPDIVLVVADSLRAASLPFHGYGRQTAPFLSRLSEEATLYERCYTSATWTRPAITGILSGRPPTLHGQYEFGKKYPIDLPCFPEDLRSRGYRTAFFTANHVVGEGYGIGDRFDRVEYQAALDLDFGARLTNDVMGWLERVDDYPVFAFVHYFPPHGPYDPPPELVGEIRAQGPPPLRAEDPYLQDRSAAISLGGISIGRIPWYQAVSTFDTSLESYVDRYDANILFADSLIEDLFGRWQAVRSQRSLIFIVTSDHGESLVENRFYCNHARMLSNRILHVPLLVWNGARRRAMRIRQPVSNLHLGDAIRGLPDVPDFPSSLANVVAGQSALASVLVSQVPMGGYRDSGWALTSGPYRLIYNDCPNDGGSARVLTHAPYPSVERSPSRRAAVPFGRFGSARTVTVAPGVSIREFEVSDEHIGQEEGTPFRCVIESEASGVLSFRCSEQTVAPVELEVDKGRSTLVGKLPVTSCVPLDECSSMQRVVEVAWGSAREVSPGRQWRTVVTIQLEEGFDLAPGVRLLGIAAEPRLATPGLSLRVVLSWELTALPPNTTAVSLELRDQTGRLVVADEHLLYSDEHSAEASRENPRPVIEAWRLRDYGFDGRRYRFQSVHWYELAQEASPGGTEFAVALRDGSSENAEARGLLPGPEVVSDAVAGLARLASSPGGSEDLVLLAELDPRQRPKADRGALESLIRRFPDEGHLRFLAAMNAEPLARKRYLRGCLKRVPSHRRARLALGRAGVRPSGSIPIDAENPRFECDYRFGHRLRLTGYAVHLPPGRRGPAMMTLWWEATAPGSHLLAAELEVRREGGSEDGVDTFLWWFIGGSARSTDVLRIGERVIETVMIPPLDGHDRVEAALRIVERWEQCYSDQRLVGLLPIRDSAGAAVEDARLGPVSVAELPSASLRASDLKRSDHGQYRLYDVEADPAERTDIKYKDVGRFMQLREALLALIPLLDSETAFTGEEVTLSEGDRRRLRALGYLE